MMGTSFRSLFLILAAVAGCVTAAAAQGSNVPPSKETDKVPVVTKIDLEGLKALLKPVGKPRLVNFWATWCDPCREEFPELVKLNRVYKDRVDLITVSLDDVDEIGTAVPKFLAEMRSTMPSYLLNASDEDAAITAIASYSSEFHGSLPFTMLIRADGTVAYSRSGKINAAVLNNELAKQASSEK